jgi:hypothetical protein
LPITKLSSKYCYKFDKSTLLQDFTNDRFKITNLIFSIKIGYSNDFNEHLLNIFLGLLSMLKKRIDGEKWSIDPIAVAKTKSRWRKTNCCRNFPNKFSKVCFLSNLADIFFLSFLRRQESNSFLFFVILNKVKYPVFIFQKKQPIKNPTFILSKGRINQNKIEFLEKFSNSVFQSVFFVKFSRYFFCSSFYFPNSIKNPLQYFAVNFVFFQFKMYFFKCKTSKNIK